MFIYSLYKTQTSLSALLSSLKTAAAQAINTFLTSPSLSCLHLPTHFPPTLPLNPHSTLSALQSGAVARTRAFNRSQEQVIRNGQREGCMWGVQCRFHEMHTLMFPWIRFQVFRIKISIFQCRFHHATRTSPMPPFATDIAACSCSYTR
jgi:hypothetical protein